jgi:hypothetical protein
MNTKSTKEQLTAWAKLGGATSRKRSEEAQKQYYCNPKICKECEKVIPYEKRRITFCCQSCFSKYRNRKRYSYSSGYTSKYQSSDYKQECDYCGILIKRPKTKKTQKRVFCTRQHQYLYHTKQKIDNGQKLKPTAIRYYLIATRGYECEECHLTIWRNKPIPLEAHHIDGDANNNKLSNLQLLCKNCHGLTDTYGAKNIGRGTRENHYKPLKNIQCTITKT